jgi:hypothetical protein
MPAALRKPTDGLSFDHSFTGVSHGTPPHQVIPVNLIISLPAHRQLPRSVWPLVCVGEVAVESFFKVKPTLYALGWQVVQPDPG